ncbi:SDR family oxidoreductase [Anditalea andensis]|uniref:NAD(P)-binding domain-containing protein n=1 Tax=Anditalea andensis TaxID=1048983 RepID=A0A074L2F3_9BACT|nr:NAD(P)H-binding protein [Anditalea andensis]KEO75364.1 hypothetical protein EL17_02160 [Anditalea andensis]
MGTTEKILVTGASGSLGLEVSKALHAMGHPIRAMINSIAEIDKLLPYTQDIVIADARNHEQLLGICDGITILISTVGKSVSLFKSDPGTYDTIDYQGNLNILREAEKSGVSRVIFTSIMGCGETNRLKLAKVHYDVERYIEGKFKDFTIFRPTGFFSGLNDLIILGKRGIIPVIGRGNFNTNSIHQADLALAITSRLTGGQKIIEIGGPQIHTRLEMAKMIKEKTGGRIVHLSPNFAKASISLIWPIKPSLYHNMDYYRYVTTRDMTGGLHGNHSFKDYLDNLNLDDLP